MDAPLLGLGIDQRGHQAAKHTKQPNQGDIDAQDRDAAREPHPCQLIGKRINGQAK